jgi:radical SAM superfamily enzyme YgiQ (UPF0313 family)
MKKVLLINSNTEVLPYPVAPLGLSLVANSLAGTYQVKVIDFAFSSTSYLLKDIKNYKPDYIGVSIRNIDNVTMRKSKWYIEELKQLIIDPIKVTFEGPVIIGGSGFSIAPVEILNYLNVDYGIIGEAENIFCDLLKELDTNSIPKSIEGLVLKNQKEIKPRIFNEGELEVKSSNIDQLIDFKPYAERGSYPIQAKRGCIHKCIYCSYPNIEGNIYRLRNVTDIVNEIEEVSKRMPNIVFEFVDSIFNSPLNHAVNICDQIIKRNLRVNLRTMGVNPGEVTDDLIRLMKQAGFSQIDCTPDSASAGMLKSYRKNFNLEKLIECAYIIRKYDMPTMWFFMMGAPKETEETIKETFDFIDEFIFEEDMVHITEGIRIIPKTELFEIALKESVISKSQNVIEPMFYVDPKLGKENLTRILEQEIGKRNNVLNSIDTRPTKELLQSTIKYRTENNINEPMFRSLLKVQNLLQV